MPKQTGAKGQHSQNAATKRSASASPQTQSRAISPQSGIIRRAMAEPRSLTPEVVRHLQGTIGNHAVQRLLYPRPLDGAHPQRKQEVSSASHPPIIQAALKVGAANDRFEDEAETVARQVVQRKGMIQRVSKNDSAAGFETSRDFELQLSRSKGNGRPLPPKTRTELEPSFGTSLGNVRIHTGANSNQLNRSIQAKAFTHGNDIHFGAGEYNPTSTQGKELLAHELTHTIQQTGGGSRQQKPGASLQAKGQAGGIDRAPALTVQRKLATTSDHLGDISITATLNKKVGKGNLLSDVKNALDNYHTNYSHSGLAEQLVDLKQILHSVDQWLHGHIDDDAYSSKVLQVKSLFKAVTIEINMLEEDIKAEPEQQAAYMELLRSGKFKYISDNATTIVREMNEWFAGRETDDNEDPEKKLRYKGRGAEVSELTQKHGLTQAEATAIGIYTASDYKYINPSLENDTKFMEKSLMGVAVNDENIKNSVKTDVGAHTDEAAMEGQIHGKVAAAGLRKLPDWSGTVYRGETWTKLEYKQRYKLNAIRTFDSFISTSQLPDKAQYFQKKATGDKMGILLILHVTKGKNVEKLSDTPFEKEIMLMPGARFKVNKIKEHAPERDRGGEKIAGTLKTIDLYLTQLT